MKPNKGNKKQSSIVNLKRHFTISWKLANDSGTYVKSHSSSFLPWERIPYMSGIIIGGFCHFMPWIYCIKTKGKFQFFGVIIGGILVQKSVKKPPL